MSISLEDRFPRIPKSVIAGVVVACICALIMIDYGIPMSQVVSMPILGFIVGAIVDLCSTD